MARRAFPFPPPDYPDRWCWHGPPPTPEERHDALVRRALELEREARWAARIALKAREAAELAAEEAVRGPR